MSINIQECTTCLTRYFPQRLMCRKCSDSKFRTVEVNTGQVEERTTLADGSALATVRIGDDVRVVAQLRPETGSGDAVVLIDQGDLEPGQAYVPTRELSQ